MMTVAEAEAFAERIREFIPAEDELGARRHYHHDRKRIEADLDGIRKAQETIDFAMGRSTIYSRDVTFMHEARARAEHSLLRTGRVYGVEP